MFLLLLPSQIEIVSRFSQNHCLATLFDSKQTINKFKLYILYFIVFQNLILKQLFFNAFLMVEKHARAAHRSSGKIKNPWLSYRYLTWKPRPHRGCMRSNYRRTNRNSGMLSFPNVGGWRHLSTFVCTITTLSSIMHGKSGKSKHSFKQCTSKTCKSGKCTQKCVLRTFAYIYRANACNTCQLRTFVRKCMLLCAFGLAFGR